MTISFHSISQSPRKLYATSDQASNDTSRFRQGSVLSDEWCSWPASAACACARASSSSLRETNTRNRSVISTTSTIPPTNSATVKRQPRSTHRTSPSSQTRFVEANWKASAEAADAPF
ncbi:MAG TPA: hypothetical protein VGH82_09230 [Gaiellaceae bacterium]